MEQTYVYEEDVEQGLTLKKIWQFIKRGWLYIVIGIIVAVILATVVALPIKSFYKSESTGSTAIEYLYEDAAQGLNPNGGTLNTDNIISPNVLSRAVETANLSEVITDISKLRAACRVEGVYPDEYYDLVKAAANGDEKATASLRNYTAIPTRYDIIISEPESLGLSEVQTKTLLDKIVAAYFDDFQSRFSVRNMFASNIYTLSKDAHKEYADIYDEYSASLKPVAEYISELKTTAPSFTSTLNNTDFATLLFDVNRLASDYETYNSYLLAHNVWKDKVAASLMLTKTQATIKEKRDNLEKRKQMLSDLISKIPPLSVTIVNGSSESTDIPGTTTAYYELLDKYNTELNDCDKQLQQYDDQLSNIKLRLENIDAETETPIANLEYAETEIAALEARSLALIEKVNSTVSDYFDTTFISSSVRRVKPPVVVSKGADFSLLVVYACAALVGLLIGAVIAGVMISKHNAKANAVSGESKPATEKPEDKKESE